MDISREKSWEIIKFSGGFLLLTGAYILAGKLGLLFAFVQSNATAVWAPTGIAITALLLFGYRFAPAVFLGAFITNLTTAGNVLTSLGIATGNTLEALAAVYLVTRFAGGAKAFEKAESVIGFSFFAGVVATAISPTIGVTTLALGGFTSWASYPQVWVTWWLGDVGGAIIVAPFLILWLIDYRIKLRGRKIAEVILLFLTLALFGVLVIFAKLGFLFVFMSPILIWVAFRFDRRTMATAMLILTEIYVWELLSTAPPSSGAMSLNESLILLQAFMATTFVTMMALSAVLAEQKKAEGEMAVYNERISREKSRDEAILSSIGDGLIVTDRDGKIVLMNPEAEVMFGWTLNDAIGKPVTQIIPVEDEKGNPVPERDRPLGAALKAGKVTSTVGVATYYYVRKNKSKFPVALTVTPVVIDGEIVGAIDLIKDITVEKEVDREKSEFISIAAHQLRTPLSSIKWLIELLLEDKLTKAQRKKLADISSSNERLINVVRNLLNITRIEGGKIKTSLETLDMKGLIAPIIKLCEQDAAQKKITFDYRPGAETYNISADRILFTEALKNILDNAIVYAPQGSIVQIALKKEDQLCTVMVSNDGPAISDDDRPHLFKKFYRGTEAPRIRPSGSGLGLYIARLNIELFGGTIWFKSPIHEDRGVTFYVSFPQK